MGWKCYCCEETFSEPDVRHEREDRGEFWGMPAFEDMYYEVCPFCGSDDVDAVNEEEEEENES